MDHSFLAGAGIAHIWQTADRAWAWRLSSSSCSCRFLRASRLLRYSSRQWLEASFPHLSPHKRVLTRSTIHQPQPTSRHSLCRREFKELTYPSHCGPSLSSVYASITKPDGPSPGAPLRLIPSSTRTCSTSVSEQLYDREGQGE